MRLRVPTRLLDWTTKRLSYVCAIESNPTSDEEAFNESPSQNFIKAMSLLGRSCCFAISPSKLNY